MKSLFHIFPIKSRLFPLNPVYSPALGILFDGFIIFAIAGKKSIEYGYDGDVFGFAADEKVLQHYIAKLGAEAICMLHQFHFGIFDDQMKNIMEVYTYEWTDEQL